jgi:hypothetical protein
LPADLQVLVAHADAAVGQGVLAGRPVRPYGRNKQERPGRNGPAIHSRAQEGRAEHVWSRMMRSLGPGQDVPGALAGERLGVAAVLGYVMSAVAPLTIVAGLVTTGFAVTGSLGLPVAFLLVGAVLGVFASGYVAMARHLPHAGAFYAYVAHGLGRPAGVAAAWLSLFTYNLLQTALYGVVGAATAPLLARTVGLELPWWVSALAAWALVAVLGVRRVELNGQVLGVLLVGEVAVICVYDIAWLARPAVAVDW